MAVDWDEIFLSVERPSQYVDSEWGVTRKEKYRGKIVLIYPDLYEIGFSNLGIHILYRIINSLPDWCCERAYLPRRDLINLMKKRKVLLFSLEKRTPLKSFDILGFSLQAELTFPDVLSILALSGIPIFSSEREDEPLIIAGGPAAFNPEPLAPFIDAFVIGDGEEVIQEMLQVYLKVGGRERRRRVLEEWQKIEGVYVPQFLKLKRGREGKIIDFEGFKIPIKRRVVSDLNHFPIYTPLVPFSEVTHDRLSVEVMRGCGRGCRFCQAGMVYRPLREREPKSIISGAINALRETGYEEIALTSLSTSDYSRIRGVLESLLQYTTPRGISISLPSLRLDSFSLKLAELVGRIKKTGLTFAPEAGSESLRRRINKNICEEEIFSTLSKAFESGWRKIKLYFMVGLPGETEDDLREISEMVKKAVNLGREVAPKMERGRVRINVTLSSFVPKPFTPFQWAEQISGEEGRRRMALVKKGGRGKGIHFRLHDSFQSVVEGVISRGGREVSSFIYRAWEKGATLQAWKDYFSFDLWCEAAEEVGIEIGNYLKEREDEATFPWDFIDIGVQKSFLLKEWKKAQKGEETFDCKSFCESCGVCGGEIGLKVYHASIKS
jgi:radical SAM family uncharacterized protein